MINTVNFLGQITPKYNHKAASPVTKPMACDSFERSTKTSDNDFIQWANETDFLNRGLKESLRDENFLGGGFSNRVYKIEGNDNYVLRIRNSAVKDIDTDFKHYILEDKSDKNLNGNFGQRVALISNRDYRKPPIEVLLKQEGITNGNPPSSVIYEEDGTIREGQLPYEAMKRKEHYAQCLQILADMPQSAYDELVANLSEIGEAGYRFDYYNSENFLLDEKNGKINIIDLEKFNNKYDNDLGNALCALTNIEYLSTYTATTDSHPVTDEEKNLAFGNTITVIDKFTKALQNNGKKYSREGYEFSIKLLNSMPMAFYLKALSHEDKCAKLKEMGVLD